MLQPAEGERAIGHEQPLGQLPLQGRRCHGSAQQSGCRQSIEAAALHTMAIGAGRRRGDGAQQWFVGLSQGQPIGANDIQGHQWLAVKAILIGGSKRITHNPDQCGGRPCIRGMRIRVQDILALFAAGQSSEQILAYLHQRS